MIPKFIAIHVAVNEFDFVTILVDINYSTVLVTFVLLLDKVSYPQSEGNYLAHGLWRFQSCNQLALRPGGMVRSNSSRWQKTAKTRAKKDVE